MDRRINKTLFHSVTTLVWGQKRQTLKLIEELGELNLALKEGDREHIVEELADVEVTLPYCYHLMPVGFNIRVNGCGIVFPYEQSHNLLSMALTSRLENGSIKNLNRALEEALKLLSISLYNIYTKHCITEREVDDWIEEKKRRTIKRMITGGFK